VIDRGKVVAEGTPRELKASIGTASLQVKLLREADTARTAKIIESVLKVPAQKPEPSLLVAPMADPELVTDLLLALRKQTIRLSEVSVKEPSLDEVFMALTGHGTGQATDKETATQRSKQ
jgi:ABC-2 type transport system ATP-binding protein